MAVTYHVEDDESSTPVSLEQTGESWRFAVDGEPMDADIRRVTGDTLSILVGGESFRVRHTESEGKLVICVRGEYYEFGVLDEREKSMRDSRHGAGGAHGHGPAGQIRSRIPGKIVSVLAVEGQRVERGDKLLVIEAMKMENEIRASAAGTVSRVLVKPGDTVETGALLMDLEAAEDGK